MPYLIERVASAYVNDNVNAPLVFRSIAVDNTPVQIGVLTTFNIYGYSILNPNNVTCYVRFYSNPAGVATIITTIQVPPGGQVVFQGSDVLWNLSTIGWVAATTGYLDTNSDAPATALIVEVHYK